MDLYIVRHGETEWNKEEIFRGRSDVPLNGEGRRQAERAGLYFRGRRITRIVSSPLSRASETAENIGRATGVAVEPLAELTDMTFGIWDGVPFREVAARHPDALAIWQNAPERLRVEGGETLPAVRERVSRCIDGIATGGGGAIAVVTHRVICKLTILHCLNIGNEHFWDMQYDPASITRLTLNDGRFTLISMNDTCHLA
jgi:broad specificity phosphatase PhoE